MNRTNERTQGILYRDFPEFYRWHTQDKNWQRRVQDKSLQQIRRIISANPTEGERYYLRVLLNNVPGATSFNDLRLVDGVILSTFHEAIERRSLIIADNTLDKSLVEAIEWMMPYALRRLFALILVFYEPSDVFGLWEKHKGTMSEHYRHKNQSNFMVEHIVLIDIQKLLQSMQKDIKMYPLPDINDTYDASSNIPR
jgi:hypothetical protein